MSLENEINNLTNVITKLINTLESRGIQETPKLSIEEPKVIIPDELKQDEPKYTVQDFKTLAASKMKREDGPVKADVIKKIVSDLGGIKASDLTSENLEIAYEKVKSL